MKLLPFGFTILATFFWFTEDANSSSLHMLEPSKISNVIFDYNVSFDEWYMQRRAAAIKFESTKKNGKILRYFIGLFL